MAECHLIERSKTEHGRRDLFFLLSRCSFFFLILDFLYCLYVGNVMQHNSSTMSNSGGGGSVETSARRGRQKPSWRKGGEGRPSPPNTEEVHKRVSCWVWSLKALSSKSSNVI